MAQKLPEGIKRVDAYAVEPKKIKIVKGFNPRQDFDTGFEELVLSIMENGVRQPITVKIDAKDRIILVNGERRVRAALEAIKRGCDIKSIKAIKLSPTLTEAACLLENYYANDSLIYSAVEEALLFNRLINYGYSFEDIAGKIGKSSIYVRERLVLCDATPELKEAIKKKKVGKTLASKIVKGSKGDANFQNELTKEASKGKKGKKTVSKAIKSKASVKEQKKGARERPIIKTEEIRDLYKAEQATLNKCVRDTRKEVWEVAVQFGRVFGIAEVLDYDTNSLADKFKSYLKGKTRRNK